MGGDFDRAGDRCITCSLVYEVGRWAGGYIGVPFTDIGPLGNFVESQGGFITAIVLVVVDMCNLVPGLGQRSVLHDSFSEIKKRGGETYGAHAAAIDSARPVPRTAASNSMKRRDQ